MTAANSMSSVNNSTILNESVKKYDRIIVYSLYHKQ